MGDDGVVRDLSPGYFSFVMATGIVSIAAELQGWSWVSGALLWIAVAGYVVLIALNVLRASRHGDAMYADLRSPSRAFGFFTFVAATSVLGTRLCLDGHLGTAEILLGVSAVAGLILGYVVPACSFSRDDQRSITRSADGSWFVWAVAVQSIAVLSATIQPRTESAHDPLALLATAAWGIGVFLYIVIGLVVAARLALFPLEPAELTAPYWVGMGATAITVVAGSTIMGMTETPVGAMTHGLVTGTTVVFWAFGTWLIPPLLFAGYWRHVRHRVPLRYEVALWSIVFPLGMYGVGSRDLGRQGDLALLDTIGHIEVWFALAAWTVTFAAMLVSVARTGQPTKLFVQKP